MGSLESDGRDLDIRDSILDAAHVAPENWPHGDGSIMMTEDSSRS
jgi:hypothetical protein